MFTNWLIYLKGFNRCERPTQSLRQSDIDSLTELPECAGYRQFVRDLNPCVCENFLMCGDAVFDPNVRD